jgi:hypothetical protein
MESLTKPLLDGGQGENKESGVMEDERIDGVGADKTKGSDRKNTAKEEGGNGTTENISDKHCKLIAGALHPNKPTESIRAKDTHPKINGDNLRASEITPPPHGERTQTVNKVATPPRGKEAARVETTRTQWWELNNLTINETLINKGLQPPILKPSGQLVVGANTNSLRIQNKQRRHKLQEVQQEKGWWTKHTGDITLPPHRPRQSPY